jgi:hypothetical protein
MFTRHIKPANEGCDFDFWRTGLGKPVERAVDLLGRFVRCERKRRNPSHRARQRRDCRLRFAPRNDAENTPANKKASQGGTTMTMTRRNLLASAGAAAASTLLARAAGAQSFRSRRTSAIPILPCMILDPSFAKYRIYSSTVEQVATGMRWAEGRPYFPEGGYCCFPTSQQPHHEVRREDTRPPSSAPTPTTPTANARSPGPARHLRALGHRRITRTEKDARSPCWPTSSRASG